MMMNSLIFSENVETSDGEFLNTEIKLITL